MTTRYASGLLNNLQTFMAVAAEGSFSGAARRLGVTQPSVSEQIRALELHFGVSLFERMGRRTRLTVAGERLRDHGRRLMLGLEEMERDLSALKDGTRTTLAIAASPIAGEVVLPSLLPLFQAENPGTSIREVIAETPAVIARLLEREVELAVIGSPFQDERCVVEVLARNEFVLIAARGHPLTLLDTVTAARLSREPLVLRERGSGSRAAVESALAAAGVAPDRLHVVAELGSTEAIMAAVVAGLGVGFVSAYALATHRPSEGLRVLPLADLAPGRDLLLVTERARPLSDAARAFRDFLLSDPIRLKIGASAQPPARG
jgi:DNA-binding transcriptional LysR family regulator